MNAKKIWTDTKKFVSKNSLKILTGGSLVGLGTTVVLVRKAAMEEQRIISETPPKDWKEHLQMVWKCYLWAAGSVIGTGTSIVTHEVKAEKIIKGTTLAFETSQAAAAMFEKKTKELLGEKKVDAINDEVAKETVKRINYGRVYGHPEDGSLWTTNITSDAWYGEEVDIRDALADVGDELNRYHFCEFDVFLNGLKKGIQTTDLTRMVGWSDSRIGNRRVPYRTKTTMYDIGNGKMVPCGVIVFDLSIMSIANRDDITLM